MVVIFQIERILKESGGELVIRIRKIKSRKHKLMQKHAIHCINNLFNIYMESDFFFCFQKFVVLDLVILNQTKDQCFYPRFYYKTRAFVYKMDGKHINKKENGKRKEKKKLQRTAKK